MFATFEERDQWLDHAKSENASYLIVAIDTFDGEGYHVLVTHEQDIFDVMREHSKDFSRIVEVYDMSKNIEEQKKRPRAGADILNEAYKRDMIREKNQITLTFEFEDIVLANDYDYDGISFSGISKNLTIKQKKAIIKRLVTNPSLTWLSVERIKPTNELISFLFGNDGAIEFQEDIRHQEEMKEKRSIAAKKAAATRKANRAKKTSRAKDKL